MLIVVIIGLIIIALAILVYRQDGTEFTKLTNYSIIDIIFNKEVRLLNSLYSSLQKANGEHRILLNVHIQDGSNGYKIPAIFVHASGVYIFTSVHKDGWIVGADRMPEWLNVLHGNKQVMFENPVFENKRVTFNVADLLTEWPSNAFQSIVLFNNSCSFQKVEVSSETVDIMKEKDVAPWVSSLVGQTVLTIEDINKIYQALEGKMQFPNKAIKGQQKKVETA